MSEYQYYEFVAVDRPLDERQLVELRTLSTRALLTLVRRRTGERAHGPGVVVGMIQR